jgi:hypothetical protein
MIESIASASVLLVDEHVIVVGFAVTVAAAVMAEHVPRADYYYRYYYYYYQVHLSFLWRSEWEEKQDFGGHAVQWRVSHCFPVVSVSVPVLVILDVLAQDGVPQYHPPRHLLWGLCAPLNEKSTKKKSIS